MITLSKEHRDLMAEAIAAFGEQPQVDMAMEECGELVAAINQFRRGRISREKLAGEIADVLITVHQLAAMTGEELVMQQINRKMMRLAKKLESAKADQ